MIKSEKMIDVNAFELIEALRGLLKDAPDPSEVPFTIDEIEEVCEKLEMSKRLSELDNVLNIARDANTCQILYGTGEEGDNMLIELHLGF
jgi:hypothetical protein